MANGDLWQPSVQMGGEMKRRLEAFERAYARATGVAEKAIGHTFAIPYLLNKALIAEGFPPETDGEGGGVQ